MRYSRAAFLASCPPFHSASSCTFLSTNPLHPSDKLHTACNTVPLHHLINSASDWNDLIDEFEQNSQTDPSLSRLPPNVSVGKQNPNQYRSLPAVETAFMASVGTALWFCGRILRLDAFILLFYPLPAIYMAARWGLQHSNHALICTTFIIFTQMGPLYAILYFLNTGLLVWTYSRALWYSWPWFPTLVAGAAAKCLGLVAQFMWISVILRYDAWKAVTFQIQGLLTASAALITRLIPKMALSAPSALHIQIAVAFVLILHSFYHVFFTQFITSLMLLRVSADVELKRHPPPLPLLSWIIRKSRKSRKR